MIKSMTAYATYEVEMNNLTLNCELRSVNHRYLDLNLKLPERLRFIETQLRTLISTKINRGKVECVISYKKQNLPAQSFVINLEAVQALLLATEQIEQLMPAALAFSALDVLAFPGIQQETNSDKTQLATAIIELVQQSLIPFLNMREREGEQLKGLIEERCYKVQQFIELAKQRIPQVLALTRAKLTERVSELILQPDFDRLEQELLFLTQKLDISEELDRLNTHIVEVLRVLKQNEPVGRRLDFLMQELNREANTLGSKSTDKEMTAIAIELKVLIEQMREQIQNIE